MGAFLAGAVTEARRELADLKKQELYKHDIRLWAKDKLGLHLWSKQVEIAEALITHKKVAVKSCHGSGKSFFAAVVVCWWVDTRKGTPNIVVSTAPTYEQVNKILWEYIRANHTNAKQLAEKNKVAPFLGKVTQDDEWKGPDGTVLGFGRKPSDTNQHGFQGIHRSNGVLAVLDESGGLADTIWTGVEAITTGSHDRILAIGNPDDINTTFGRIFHPRRASTREEERNFAGDSDKSDEWYKITISAYDTPNFTGEYMPEAAKGGMVTPAWAEEKKRSWGEKSPRYLSKVLGEFSQDSTTKLFSLGTLNKGVSTEIYPRQDSKLVLGVDVARMGEDYTVVYSYHDGVLRQVDKWNKTNAVETGRKIAELALGLGAVEVRIDGVGLGGPVVDIVNQHCDNRFSTISMIGNAASPDLLKWINARAYWYDTLRERMLDGQIDISFEDSELQDELGDVEYHFKNQRSSLQLEKKEDIRARTGKSPDYADAAVYASADLFIDPTDPVAAMNPGDEFSIGLDDFLSEMDMQISPW